MATARTEQEVCSEQKTLFIYFIDSLVDETVDQEDRVSIAQEVRIVISLEVFIGLQVRFQKHYPDSQRCPRRASTYMV